MQFKIWAYKWLNIYQKRSVKARTRYLYNKILNNHFKDWFTKELEDITIETIEELINKKLEFGLSSNTVNLFIAVLKNIFSSAYENKLISYNPCYKLKRIRSFEKDIHVFTLIEQQKLEQFCLNGEDYRLTGIVLCLYTGLRIGELLALEWKDIDFIHHILYVNKTISISTNGAIITPPKTISSKRIIPLSNKIINYLKTIKKLNLSNYIICNKRGERMSIRSYQYIFEHVLIKLNIQKLNFHCLRHTFATRAIEQGIDIKTLSEILGHKNATITINRYVHSLLETKKKAMNKLAKLLDYHCV